MTDKVNIINESIKNAFKIAEASAEEDERAVIRSDAAIQEVMSNFTTIVDKLTSSTLMMQVESDGIRDEIESMLVDLQFQDRTSQILVQVKKTLDELEETIRTHQFSTEMESNSAFDIRMWLDKMEQGYAMLEQRLNHIGQAQKSAAEPEITFF